MKHISQKTPNTSPPMLANQLMSLLLPKRVSENIIGDLEEEFYQLAQHDLQQANKWYWRQSLETSMVYIRNKIGSVEVLGRLNFYLPLAMSLIVAGLIIVLSLLEEPAFISPTFWNELLQGKIHTALFSGNFWHNFWSLIRMAEWGMFMHFQSFIIASINIFVLIYLNKKQQVSALKLALWGYSLAFIPYLWSLIHIASHNFAAKQIGPIIATGIISILYMLLPVSYMIHRKLKHQQEKIKQFNEQE